MQAGTEQKTQSQIGVKRLKSASQTRLFASTCFCKAKQRYSFLGNLSDKIAALCKGVLAQNRCSSALSYTRDGLSAICLHRAIQ